MCAHLIFGLPGETPEMMLQSLKTVTDLGVDAVKIHPLYVVKNTALAAQFLSGSFTPIDEATYVETVAEGLRTLPEHVAVQRITAGVGDDSLLGPAWCKEKNRAINTIRNRLREAGITY